MDRMLFLNSSGAIVTRYPYQHLKKPLPVAPYVEAVALPVVSVDPAALYGDHPENLATVGYSSGAALTFFCDSVAGGSDGSGDGSPERPWRSLVTAAAFLSCNGCELFAAAPYVQLKVRGTVDYLSSGVWSPFWWGPLEPRFILTGWDELCTLGGHSNATVAAGYLFGIRGRPVETVQHPLVASGCEITGYWGSAWKLSALNCRIAGGSAAGAGCLWSCSAGADATYVGASVCFGGSYHCSLGVTYACSPTVSVSRREARSVCAMLLGDGNTAGAAVGAVVTAVATGTSHASACGIYTLVSTYLGNCSVTATARAEAADYPFAVQAFASATAGYPSVAVSGGRYDAHATAKSVADGSGHAEAEASAGGVDAALVTGASFTLTANAETQLTGWNGGGETFETEKIVNLGTRCTKRTSRYYSGGVVTSTHVVSGCV